MVNNEDTNRNNIFLMDQTANPAPLGLCAFGTTTILLSLWNAGVIGISSPIIAMAIFYGGLAQMIARAHGMEEEQQLRVSDLCEFRVLLDYLSRRPHAARLSALQRHRGQLDLAAFLTVWGIVAFGLLICTLNMHRSLQVTVLAVFLTIVLLVAAELTESGLVKLGAGLMGILPGALAIYIGLGQVINEIHDRKIIPV